MTGFNEELDIDLFFAVYPKVKPLAINAPATSFDPKLPDFKSENIKCLKSLPCCCISFASNFSIFERRASNLGEWEGMSSSNILGLNCSVSNLYVFDDLLQLDRFRTQSGSNIVFIFSLVNFSKVSISFIFSKFASDIGLSSTIESSSMSLSNSSSELLIRKI